MAFKTFVLTDYLVFFSIVFSFIIVGVYYGVKEAILGRKNYDKSNATKTHKLRDFLTAYSSHSVVAAGLSLFSTYVSPSTLIGTPSTVYYHGTQAAVQVFAYAIAVTFANFVFVPVFYKLKLKSTLEYLEGRFDERMRVIAVIIYSMNSLLTMACWLFVPAYAFQQVTQRSLIESVIFAGAIGTFYTSIGGMRAVMFADMIQTCIMVFSLLSVIIKGVSLLGGLENVISKNIEHKRIYITDFDPNPFTYKMTFWTVIINGTVHYSMIYSTYQPVISRYMPAATLSKAKRVLWMQIPLMSVMYLMCCFSGVVVFAFYHDCDPFIVKRIKRVEEFMPMYASDIGADIPGFLGFFMAGLFSGSLSSMSSNLNSLATLTFEDVIRKFCKTDISERKTKYVVRGVAVVYGILTMVMVSVIYLSKNAIRARTLVSNMMGSPLFGVYLLGVLNRRSTTTGSLIALFTGVIFGMYFLINHYQHYPGVGAKSVSVKGCAKFFCNEADPLEPGCQGNYSYINPSTAALPTSAPISSDFVFINRVSYHMGGFFNVSLTFLVGSIASLFTRRTKTHQDLLQYLAPFYAPRHYSTDTTKEAHDEEKI